MSSWAKPGVKCVCLRDTPWIAADTVSTVATGPVKDEICTIQQVVVHPEHGVGLAFVEHWEPNGRASVFPIIFFRPLVDQSDDLVLFAHHLDRVDEPA